MSDEYCYCDDGPDYHTTKIVKSARKTHKCVECRRMIQPGESYENTWGAWGGEISVYKVCCHCLALREYVSAHIPCFCWHYGQMREEAMEMLRDNWQEAEGLWFGGARLLIKSRQARLTGS